METRLNPETTSISNDYTKKLRDEVESNNKRISELSVFIESLKAYEKETRLLMDRNTGLMMVINTINSNIMKPVDEAALNSPILTIDASKLRAGGRLGDWAVNINMDNIATTQGGLINGIDSIPRSGAIRP